MAKMKVDKFIEMAKKMANSKTVYATGMWGQAINKTIVTAKAKQYPSQYKNKDFSKYYGNSYRGYDCVCLIKAILWGGTPDKLGSYGSNGVPDIGTEQMFSVCTNKCKPVEAKPGYLLHMKGHVGIYIGNNQVIECTVGKYNKVAITSIGYQKWTEAGKLPYVDYISQTIPTAPSEKPKNDIRVGSSVVIKSGAVYGGLANTRGRIVPKSCCGPKYTIAKLATHKGEPEALIAQIYSWVALKYLKEV